MMPPMGAPTAGAGTFQIPAASDRRQTLGPLFYASLLAAGQDGCECKACKYLTKLRDQMVNDAEELLNAPNG